MKKRSDAIGCNRNFKCALHSAPLAADTRLDLTPDAKNRGNSPGTHRVPGHEDRKMEYLLQYLFSAKYSFYTPLEMESRIPRTSGALKQRAVGGMRDDVRG
jgi:hypothetical protein